MIEWLQKKQQMFWQLEWPKDFNWKEDTENITELKQLVNEGKSKNLPEPCAGLIDSYRKCLVELTAAKQRQQVINSKGLLTFSSSTIMFSRFFLGKGMKDNNFFMLFEVLYMKMRSHVIIHRFWKPWNTKKTKSPFCSCHYTCGSEGF